MANRIKRNTVFIEVMTLTDSNAFGAGEAVGNMKIDGVWIAKDSNGKRYRNLVGNLRNENYFQFINQYSMSDIICYLMDKNVDYQTVMTEMLVDAVYTAFEETIVVCLEDLYDYITTYLI